MSTVLPTGGPMDGMTHRSRMTLNRNVFFVTLTVGTPVCIYSVAYRGGYGLNDPSFQNNPELECFLRHLNRRIPYLYLQCCLLGGLWILQLRVIRRRPLGSAVWPGATLESKRESPKVNIPSRAVVFKSQNPIETRF